MIFFNKNLLSAQLFSDFFSAGRMAIFKVLGLFLTNNLKIVEMNRFASKKDLKLMMLFD